VTGLLIPLVVGAACLALFGTATHSLLGLYFVAQLSQQNFSVSGVFIDGIDVVLAVVALAIATRGLPPGSRLGRVPHLWLWALLGVFLVISYAVSPGGSVHMTDPIRVVYQSYRYALRGVVMYPLCHLLVTTDKKFDDLTKMVVIVAVACSLMSWAQGYGGQWGTGPFATKNVLAAALAGPVVFVVIDLLYGRRPGLALLTLAVLGRGALFASSRGAFAGMLVGSAVGWYLLWRAGLRGRVTLAATAGVLAIGLGILVKPDLLERPTVARFFTTFDSGQNTLVWRTNERWPHFFARARAKPWFGWGDSVDLSLGPKANTPHNGYLALAVSNGFPVLVLYLAFAAFTLRDAYRAGRRAREPDEHIRAAKICAMLACTWTHNVIDAVVVLPFVGGQLWLYAAYAARMANRGRVVQQAAAPITPEPVRTVAALPVSGANRS
jgi:hypothetical protein